MYNALHSMNFYLILYHFQWLHHGRINISPAILIILYIHINLSNGSLPHYQLLEICYLLMLHNIIISLTNSSPKLYCSKESSYYALNSFSSFSSSHTTNCSYWCTYSTINLCFSLIIFF
jgi:hypothetical protein